MKTPISMKTLPILFLTTLCLFHAMLIQANDSRQATRGQQSLLSDFENKLAEKLFDEAFELVLARDPERQTRLGIHDNNHQWNNISRAYAEETERLQQAQWEKIKKSVSLEHLNYQNRISYRLMEYNRQRAQKAEKFWYHNYRMTQMYGVQASIPAFLINFHPARQVSDLEDYIARLSGIGEKIDQTLEIVQAQEKRGIMPPAFVFPYVISDSQNVISGRPFDHTEKDSPLLEDFRSKMTRLNLTEAAQRDLLERAQQT
ncbi:MAG: DUF885 family protein, partial [Gammaproteobacteria bacterium]|nr:DUF885 family protein [Gammaproteobacteria bacterium]